MPDLLTSRQRRLTSAGLLLAMFLGALDQTIVSTALPRIVADLHGLDRFTWVATAYLAASTALVPLYGKLADMYPRRTLEVLAVSIFLVGSGLCGLAGEFGPLPGLGDGMTQLIVFRVVQGVGGAGLLALALIIVADLFPPAERGKYQGLMGAVFGASSVLGPLLGGWLTDHAGSWVPGMAGWRFIFYVNLPLGVVTLWFIVTQMPPLRPRTAAQVFDGGSAALLVGGLALLIVGLQLPKVGPGWASPQALALLAGAVLALALFVARSLRHPNPILALSLFGNAVFRPAGLALFLLGGGFLGIVLFQPLFMVNVLGESATRAGASLMPVSLGVVSGSILSGQLVARFGHYRRWMMGGLTLALGGLALLATMPLTISYYRVLGYLAVCGLGLGPTLPLYTLAVQNAVAPALVGQATAASQFFRQIGGVLAASVLGAVLTFTLSRELPAPPLGNGATHSVVSREAVSAQPTPARQAAFAHALKRVY
ncbi:MAG: MDR family MFS transporter [Janthinobacterium lividum]